MRRRYREPKIQKRGKYYTIRVTAADGQRRVVKLGTDMAEARKNWLDYMAQLMSSKSDFPNYRVDIKQAVESYLATKRKQLGSPNSFVRYCEIIHNFCRVLRIKYPALVYMDEIKEYHITDYISYRVDGEGRAHRTVNHERNTLSNFFRYLIEEKNCLEHNPVKRVKPLAEPTLDEFFYTKEQTLLILAEARKVSEKIAWETIIATFFYTGMRRNELRFLTWDDIDFDREKILIRAKQVTPKIFFNPKTKERRDIPVHSELLPLLRNLPRRSDRWVFTNSVGNYFAQDAIRTQLRKICQAAGVPVRAQHKTRHSWASQSTENGVPLDVIQSIGGWKDAQTMNRYKHLSEDYKAGVFLERFSIKSDKACSGK